MFLRQMLKLIEVNGISKNKLLVDLNLSKNAFVDWEKRGTVPGGETLTKIADYFNVSVDYLLGRTEDKKGPPATVSSDEGAGSPLEEQLIGYVRRLTPDQQDFLLAQIKTMQERQ